MARNAEVQKATCSAHRCKAKATHVARHGVYRGLPLCAKHHEGPRPEPTAKASAKSEPVEPFTFREVGLIYAMACSSLSKRETVGRARAHAPGTSAGWMLAEAPWPDGVKSNPWTCCDHPKTHKHYLFVC